MSPSGLWDQGRVPIHVLRARPYDLVNGIERNVWLATSEFETNEEHEGWLAIDGDEDDYVDCGDVLDRASTSFAFGARFRTDATQTGVLVGKGVTVAGTGFAGYCIGVVSGFVAARVSDSSNEALATASVTYDDGEWHVLIAVVDRSANELRLYFDGSLVDTESIVGFGSLDNDLNLRFGLGRTTGTGVSCDLERVICWPAAASIADMTELFDARDLTSAVVDGTPSEVPDGAWPINEGYDVRVWDVSGSAFHGEAQFGTTIDHWSAIAPPPGTIRGVLSKPFSVSASLVRGGTQLGTSAIPSFGSIGALNPNGVLDYLLGYSWDRRLLEVRSGFSDQDVSAMGLTWTGLAENPDRADRTELVLGVRGIEDRLDVEINEKYRSGFEPSVAFNGSDNSISFGAVLDHTTDAFVCGVIFRTTNVADQMLYGRKAAAFSTAAGYSLGLVSTGAVAFTIANGTTAGTASYTPPDGYDDGELHSLVGVRKTSTGQILLYYDGVLVDTQSVAGMGSISAVASLYAGRNNSGTQLFTGELERIAQDAGEDPSAVLAAFSERFADDADASVLTHYIPLTENFGTSAGDGSPSGFDGTINGTTSPEVWTGTPNGGADVDGKVIPIVIGRARVCPARWVDPVKLILQVADRAVDEVFSVREGMNLLVEDTTTTGDIFRNPPASTKWRWDTKVVNGVEQTYLRLANQPSGSITFGASHPNATALGTVYPGANCRAILERKLTVTVPNAFAFDSAVPYISGDYFDEPITARAAVDAILSGVGGRWTVDPRLSFNQDAKLYVKLFRVEDVSGESPDAVYALDPDDAVSDFAENGFELLGFSPNFRTVTVKYDRYRGHLTSLTEPHTTLVSDLLAEFRSVTLPHEGSAAADAISELFAGAEDEEVESAIRTRADAVAEATRLVTLHSQLLPIYRGERTGGQRERWIGDIVDVVGTRLLSKDGSGDEKTLRFLVVGVDEDSARGGSRLELFGGFEV